MKEFLFDTSFVNEFSFVHYKQNTCHIILTAVAFPYFSNIFSSSLVQSYLYEKIISLKLILRIKGILFTR